MRNKNLTKNRIFLGIVIFFMFNPLILMQYFDSKPEFIGFDENATYTWKTTFNKKPLTNLYEDMGFSDDDAEDLTDEFFEYMSFSEITEEWKIEPIFMSDEQNAKVNHEKTDYVKYMYKLVKYHKAGDENSRHTIDDTISIRIYEYKPELYRDMYIEWLVLGEETSPYLAHSFFLANDINWKELVEEINDEVDADYFNIKVETVNFGHAVGMEILFLDEEYDNLKQLKLIDKYYNGLLYFKELTYNYETIYKFELENMPIFLYENWILITILSSVVVLIMLAYLYIKKRRK